MFSAFEEKPDEKRILVYRVVPPMREAAQLRALAQLGVPDPPADLLELLRSRVVRLLTAPFERVAGYPTPFPIGRYGNGHFGVLYSALSDRTAVEEGRFHRDRMEIRKWETSGRRVNGKATEVMEYNLEVFQFIFKGPLINILGCAERYPEVCEQRVGGQTYDVCQRIADELRKRSAAILAPSVRDEANEGVCLPIFDQQSVQLASAPPRSALVNVQLNFVQGQSKWRILDP